MNEGKEIKDGGREEEEGLKRTTGKLWGDMEGERGAIMPLPPRPSFVLTFLFFSLTFCPSVLLSICPSTRPSFPPSFFPSFLASVRPSVRTPLKVQGLGCEDALIHFLNYVWPNIFETSPHVINAVFDAIEGLRVSLGKIGIPIICTLKYVHVCIYTCMHECIYTYLHLYV